MSPAACRGVELGHEFAVSSPGGGEFLVAFFQLEPQVGDLLLEVGDLVAEGVDVGGRAEHLGQAVFELLDTGLEPDRPLVGGEQVGLQRCPGDGRAGSFAGGRRGGFERVDLAEQVAVPVEEGAVTAAARAMDETLISVPSAAALLSAAMTRWRRRAESACRPLVIAAARGSAVPGSPGLRVMRGPRVRVRAGWHGPAACRDRRPGACGSR